MTMQNSAGAERLRMNDFMMPNPPGDSDLGFVEGGS
jgi:hypothetical protein